MDKLLLFIERPIDYDDFLAADPAECAEKFFANAISQKWVIYYFIGVKIMYSTLFALIGGLLYPIFTGAQYDVFIDEQDYYFMCAMGQPGFSEELFEGDWWYQKAYLKQLARDVTRNTTPLFALRALMKLLEVFSVMGSVV